MRRCGKLPMQTSAALILGVLLLGCMFPVAAEELCNCECCEVSYRPPSMQVRGVDEMCSVMVPEVQEEKGLSCPEECKTDPKSAIVTTTQGYILQYSRFCFQGCIPMANAKVGDACEEIPPTDRSEVRTGGGNGQDPATLQEADDSDGLDVEAQQASDTQAVEEEAPAEKEETPQEKEEDEDTGILVADAAGKQAQAAGIEARTAEAEAKSMRLVSQTAETTDETKAKATAVRDAQAEIRSAAVQAALFAKSAAEAAAAAKAEEEEIKNAPAEAAKEAAAEAVHRMQDKVNEAKFMLIAAESKFSNVEQQPQTETMFRAAAPYVAAMGKAIGIRNEYALKATELNNLAGDLQRNARIVGRQAAVYANAGQTDLAAQMRASAAKQMSDAEAADADAHRWHDVATQISDEIPQYQVAAGFAGMRAHAIAPVTLKIPSVLPPGLLQTKVTNAATRSLRRVRESLP
eukprot:gnl/TRDRNA2_/TRDRNA2_183269_c0_seq1.p1 gnl/TRDRNA2_/TRDRNA2_183269_c0~~gnl/TRDRNA2_/TRDRNA2_183269_c0_seq1.p1  ORF type:complete len:462 (+),score=126.31 gnl/TRDRNA2_/TRDRNA2_183269_c0_seq1:112-1497(+)